MSIFLLALSTLEKNEGKVPLCTLPIRTPTCGNNFSCHYKPDVDEILNNFNLVVNHEIKKNFAFPQKWFCNEFILLSLRAMEEQSKKQIDSLQTYLERRPLLPKEKDIHAKIYTEQEIEDLIMNQNSVKEIFDNLEELNFRCYYGLTDLIKNKNEKGLQALICYQEADEHCLIANESIKVIFHIEYKINGDVDVVDCIITKSEDVAFQKIIDFEKSL